VLAEGDEALCALLAAHLCLDPEADQELKRRTEEVRCALEAAGISRADLGELAAAALKERAERLCNAAVRETGG
jgi:hypothetical protein